MGTWIIIGSQAFGWLHQQWVCFGHPLGGASTTALTCLMKATAEQKAAAQNAKKMPPTSQQLARQQAASKDRNLQASVNKGHPNNEAIKSFNQTHEHGKGAEGLGAAAGAGKAENKPGTVSEH